MATGWPWDGMEWDSPLALEVGEGNLLELTVLKDGGGREGRGGLLNKCLGSHLG